MTDSAEILRSRHIRHVVLTMLWNADGTGSRFGFSFDQLKEGFVRNKTTFHLSELRRELNDMAGENLITVEYDEDLTSDVYRIAPRGRDFKRAGCPWHRIDEFMGRQ